MGLIFVGKAVINQVRKVRKAHSHVGTRVADSDIDLSARIAVESASAVSIYKGKSLRR